MYQIYILAVYLLLPLALLRLYVLGFRQPGYRLRWRERLGRYAFPGSYRDTIWIHAVSLGEVHAARPIVAYLNRKYPRDKLLITTVTPSGARAVEHLYADTAIHHYLPYDLPGPVRRFLKHFKPRICLIMETEIWPCLYRSCEKQNIPVALINARLSGKSMKGYRLLKSLSRDTLRRVSVIAAQSGADAERFRQLGALKDRVFNCGNIKFDMEPPRSIHERADAIRFLYSQRRILIAASTHEGEDEIVLDAFTVIRKTYPGCLLIIAPRHPERSASIADLCRGRGYSFTMYSDELTQSKNEDIMILDTIGQLQSYYAAADVSFVGGSLVATGGHNMLEPAALGVPVISGEYLFNFAEVSRLLEQAGALIKVKNADELAQSVVSLFQDNDRRTKMGEMAKSVVAKNRGSTEKIVKLIEEIL